MMRCLIAMMLMVGVAHAETDGGYFVSAGINLAATEHDSGDTGFSFGGEISAGFGRVPLKNSENNWPDLRLKSLGGYADVVRDFTTHTTRFSIGPEVGTVPVGIDGGLLLQVGGEGRTGVTIRGVL